jgi:histidyl-tRNA synthetase
MAIDSRNFQAPKGTRDFYPQDMAVRRYIENVWRTTSINHGFDEVEGPMFEDLDLYTHKSGPGIVSELFQVFSGKDKAEIEQIQKTGQAPFALRPEFTPTLARMVAAKAAELPRPIKWFAIPQHFRAERPQRGRLREFLQWNVDFIGDDSPKADAEVIATAVVALKSLGLGPNSVRVKVSHRHAVAALLRKAGVIEENLQVAMELLDRRNRMSALDVQSHASTIGLDIHSFDRMAQDAVLLRGSTLGGVKILRNQVHELVGDIYLVLDLKEELRTLGVADWCDWDFSIVRGLAYYTGTVFEIHEASGAERAIAGGGRYDNLIESFGGPKLPACGFGMGDVVLGLVLKDNLLLNPEKCTKRPHAFVISAGQDAADAELPGLVASLRRAGFHVRHSYKASRDIGKQLAEARKCFAIAAVILGDKLEDRLVEFKDLDAQSQETIAIDAISVKLKEVIRRNDDSK